MSNIIHREVRLENTTSRHAFLELTLVEDGVLGDWAVKEAWGAIGTSGQHKQFTFGKSKALALAFISQKIAAKKQRGYEVTKDTHAAMKAATMKAREESGDKSKVPSTELFETPKKRVEAEKFNEVLKTRREDADW